MHWDLAPFVAFFSPLLRQSDLALWWALSTGLILALSIVLVRYEFPAASRNTASIRVFLSGIGALGLVTSSNFATAIVCWQLVALPLFFGGRKSKNLPMVFLTDLFSFVLMATGAAFFYAQYQSLSFELMSEAIQAEAQASDVLLYTGTALWLTGILVRIGAVPFHLALVERCRLGRESLSGIGALILAFSATGFLCGFVSDVLQPSLGQWEDFLSLLGLATLWAGTLGILVDPRWSNFLAYGLTAQAGWTLLGVAAGVSGSLESEIFLDSTVAFVSLFLVLFVATVLEKNAAERTETLLQGMAHSQKCLAFLLVTGLFNFTSSLPGGGMTGKLLMLSHLSHRCQPWILVVACLSLPFLMYVGLNLGKRVFEPVQKTGSWPFPLRLQERLLWILALATWVFGFFPAIAWLG